MSTILTVLEGATIIQLPEGEETSSYFTIDCEEGEISLKFKDRKFARVILDLAGSGDLTSFSLGVTHTAPFKE